jgi:hypothetical protein
MFKLLSLPLYMVEELQRIVSHTIQRQVQDKLQPGM